MGGTCRQIIGMGLDRHRVREQREQEALRLPNPNKSLNKYCADNDES